jgi:hypothetical protein
MSDIQAIIELIEEGHRNNDHGDGRRQINEAVSMLRKTQEDDHLHSGQRWELSQILGCGPLWRDIEKAVKEIREAQRWQPIETADTYCFGEILAYEAGNGHIYRTSYCREDGAWLISSTHEIWHPTYWIPLPLPPSLAETE